MIFCNGLTQRAAPDPQRIDFGQGKEANTSARMPEMMSEVVAPGRIRLTIEVALVGLPHLGLVEEPRPAARRKPWTAFSGEPTRGPLRSSTVSGWRSGKPSTMRVRRRGVTNGSARSQVSCAFSRRSQTSRFRSSAARADAPGSPRRAVRAATRHGRAQTPLHLLTCRMEPSRRGEGEDVGLLFRVALSGAFLPRREVGLLLRGQVSIRIPMLSSFSRATSRSISAGMA